MPTANYYIQPEDGWVEVVNGGVNFLRLTRQPPSHPMYVAGGASPPTAGASASGTINITGAGPSAAETVTVGTDVYTFVVTPVDPFDVAIGVDATETGANLAAAITANSSVAFATSALGAVTVQALSSGTIGNSVALAENAANTTVSGATLTGGIDAILGVALDEGTKFFVNVTTAENFYVRTITPKPDGPLRVDVYYIPNP